MRIPICSVVVSLFIAVSSSAAWLNETNVGAEADYCNLQFPSSINIAVNQSTGTIYGRIYELGVTEAPGPSVSITAQLGYGPFGSDPTVSNAWQWFPATYNVQVGNDDEYQGSFVVNSAGTYAYTYRFSFDGGTDWTAGDLNGAGSNSGLTFEPSQLGTLTVTPEPAAPWLAALLGCVWLQLRHRRRSPAGVDVSQYPDSC
jgi:hypothetical protein